MEHLSILASSESPDITHQAVQVTAEICSSLESLVVALADFADEWQVLSRHQLIEIDDAGIRLTARGMFFSDTVA